MSLDTLKHYNTKAESLCQQYDRADMSSLHSLFLRYLDPGSKVLEIGCGSGRDSAFLKKNGFQVTATDASQEMLNQAIHNHPELKDICSCVEFPLTDNSPLLQNSFDSVIAIAIIMHIPENSLFEFVMQLKQFLAPGGTIIISTSINREPAENDQRLFIERPPEKLCLLFERLGFSLLAKHKLSDSLGRSDIQWVTLVFQLKEQGGLGAADQIETIINRDKKDATYKLALLRSLCDISQSDYHQAIWHNNGTVSIPLGLIAERWLQYYWPIIEADCDYSSVQIPQKRGLEINKPIAFCASMKELINQCTSNGGMDAFFHEFRNSKLSNQTSVFADLALNKIANTIVAGPVKYSGGALDSDIPIFSKKGSITAKGKLHTPKGLLEALGHIYMPAEVWREFCLLGYWISEAIILRWAELTHQISNKQVSVATVIEKLLMRPQSEREQTQLRSFYQNLNNLECVWSGKSIQNGFDIDHVVPFSLWHNNDLWNLLPSDPRENNQKRDKLITMDLLKKRRDVIIGYWEMLRESHIERFDFELSRSLVGSSTKHNNWQIPAFTALIEAVETLALQRGIPRWEPKKVVIPVKTLEFIPPVIEEIEEETIELPFYPDIKMACGRFEDSSFDYSDEETISIPNPHGNLSPKKHFVVYATGDSMTSSTRHDSINDGDLLLLERNNGGSISNQIFAVQYLDEFGDSSFVIKYIKKDASNKYRLTSFNKAYPDIPVTPANMSPIARLKSNLGLNVLRINI